MNNTLRHSNDTHKLRLLNEPIESSSCHTANLADDAPMMHPTHQHHLTAPPVHRTISQHHPTSTPHVTSHLTAQPPPPPQITTSTTSNELAWAHRRHHALGSMQSWEKQGARKEQRGRPLTCMPIAWSGCSSPPVPAL